MSANSLANASALDRQFIEAYRAADKKIQRIVMNFLTLFNAWDHSKPDSEQVIRRRLAALGLPPETTLDQAIAHLQKLAQQASETRK